MYLQEEAAVLLLRVAFKCTTRDDDSARLRACLLGDAVRAQESAASALVSGFRHQQGISVAQVYKPPTCNQLPG